jgi:hypothetical protein
MRGGARKGAGIKPGPTTDHVKVGIRLSQTNNKWIRAQKGKGISRLINMALDAMRERER